MDIDIAGWILEFLLRQNSLDDRLLNVLIRVLPLPNNNSSLKKRLILQKLESDIKKGTISERTLEFLEQIEELDHREGTEVSEAMKTAYCTVAVHCTAKFIEESADDNKWNYFSAVRRIWRGRIREMEKFDVVKRVGLVSDNLLAWMDDLEAGTWVVNVCENVLVKYEGLDVLGAVRGFVIEAKEKMGPSFLELVVETLSDDALREIVGLGKDEGLDDQIKDRAADGAPNVGQGVEANANSKDNEMCKENVLPRRKHVAMRRRRGAGHGTHRGAELVDPETWPNRYNIIPTPEVNKIREALDTSTLDLHAAVKDLLPDALRIAEFFRGSIAGGNMAHDRVAGAHNRVGVDDPSALQDGNGEALHANEDDLDVGVLRDQYKGPKIRIMEQNSSAHTVQGSDSIDSDSSDEGSPTRPHLPSPKKRSISPLKKYENKKPSKTRNKKRWTTIEEDTLRTGVLKYGRGNWKLILNMYCDIFVDRTEVDLKDKWRNLTR